MALPDKLRALWVVGAFQQAPAACKILAETYQERYACEFASSMEDAINRLQRPVWDVCVVSYLGEGGLSASAFLRHPQVLPTLVPVIALIPPDHRGEVRREMAALGASDCLVTTAMDAERLAETIDYAVLRAQAQNTQRDQRFARILSLLSAWTAPVVQEGEGKAGDASRLAALYPQQFADLSEEYGLLMDFLRDAGDAASAPLSQRLSMLADRLLYLSAQPQDVVELHQNAHARLRESAGGEPLSGQAYEGSCATLAALVVHLCQHYRHYVSVSRRLEAVSASVAPPIANS